MGILTDDDDSQGLESGSSDDDDFYNMWEAVIIIPSLYSFLGERSFCRKILL
jgi:hypothetical protein